MISYSVKERIRLCLLDACLRLDIRGALAEMRAAEKDAYRSIASFQLSRLKELLMTGTTDADGNSPLKDLPILTKQMLRGRCATGTKKTRFQRRTTGTTGEPIVVWLDKEALSWQLAARYHTFRWHGIRIGDKEARFWGRPLTGMMYKFKDFLLARRRFNLLTQDPAARHAEFLRLKKYQPAYLYGYTSLLIEAAKYIDSEKLEPPTLKAVICTAETVLAFQREYMEKVFRCPVYVEYGCSETDIIAMECEEKRLHVLSFNVLLETTDSSTAVVTDLHNKATPLIRYALGDTLSMSEDRCKCGRGLPVIEKVEGRTVDQVICDAERAMHVVAFAYLLEDIAQKGYELKQFKVVKQGDVLTFHIDMERDRDSFERQLLRNFQLRFGDRLQCQVAFGPLAPHAAAKYSYFEEIH